MDSQTQQLLRTLIREQRTAALGTLRIGAPEVTMVPFAATRDCTTFYLHLSKLAHHTQNILKDPRVSFMLCEKDDGTRPPQSLARVSIQGAAIVVSTNDDSYETARAQYLERFPQSAMMFGLGDFSLYKIVPQSARFVAGFAQTHNLTIRDFQDLGSGG